MFTIHAFASFQCHGCTVQYNIACTIDIIALYCIYSMLIMFSYLRLITQFKIKSYYNIKHYQLPHVVSSDSKIIDTLKKTAQFIKIYLRD